MSGFWGRRLGSWLLKGKKRTTWAVLACLLFFTVTGWNLMRTLGTNFPAPLHQQLPRQAPPDSSSSSSSSSNRSSWGPAVETYPAGPDPSKPPPVRAFSRLQVQGHGAITAPLDLTHNRTSFTLNQTGSRLSVSPSKSKEGDQEDGNHVLTSHRKGTFNFTEWVRVQDERLQRLREGCARAQHALRTPTGGSGFYTRSLVDEGKHVVYCPVEKSASTFFRRFMYSLHSRTDPQLIASPFDVPIMTALRHKFQDLRSLFRSGRSYTNTTRFLVVREPFSRLFSAYVDKVLVPNSYYWKIWGVKIVSQFRTDPSPRALRCGHDVSFQEFVKYVLHSLHRTDEHVQPVDRLCSPCTSDLSVVARMETLKWDFQYLLKLLNLRIANFSMDTLMTDVATDAVTDSTFSAFEFYEELKSCVSLYETCQRLWLKMQLRGVISEDLPLPLSAEQTETMKAEEMVSIFEDARRKSQDSEKLKQQKEKALKDAYATISSNDLRRLTDIYDSDFTLFGYDKQPSFIG
ncbi:uncharacterized protein LOC143288798 [Babylonia areolata]|uniref:uncharacterized protein LOC143288798 n=1 Tax=Babylonia areolata TaxID=304850 RepID=UPI003FD2742F